jgi:hypothetical protein
MDVVFLFQTPHAVQWMRPESQEGCEVSDWFNMLVLHQNRLSNFVSNVFERLCIISRSAHLKIICRVNGVECEI